MVKIYKELINNELIIYETQKAPPIWEWTLFNKIVGWNRYLQSLKLQKLITYYTKVSMA